MSPPSIDIDKQNYPYITSDTNNIICDGQLFSTIDKTENGDIKMNTFNVSTAKSTIIPGFRNVTCFRKISW